MKKIQSQIIDVRNAAEFEKGHAKGSINIPINQLANHLEEIRQMKEPPIMVCGGGTRNKKAQNLICA